MTNPTSLSQTQLGFEPKIPKKLECKSTLDNQTHNMMNNEQTANPIHFPEDIFSKILSYNDNSVERRQRQLWESITIEPNGEV